MLYGVLYGLYEIVKILADIYEDDKMMKDVIDSSVEKKRMDELKTVKCMIEIYCRGNHNTKKGELCQECQDIMTYAESRVQRCPHMEDKTLCAMCKTHCYAPTYREKIRQVMRYSGPRMLWRNPIMTIRHLLLGWGMLK